MTFKKSTFSIFSSLKACILVTATIVLANTATAGNLADTSKKLLLASADKKTEAAFITREANVVFPEILKGNEADAIPYIEQFCKKRRDYLVRMHTQGKKLLPKAVTILKKYNLPEEFKILLTLESAYNGNAVSKAGAVGFWQIMDEVAKEYGLKFAQQLSAEDKKKLVKKHGKKVAKIMADLAKQKDERKNFNRSTTVAARYLCDRRRNLNDNWLLVVASYNCGVGNVWNAMAKTGKEAPTFWDIKNYLPAETRAYVMNFITLNVIFSNYEKFMDNSLTFNPEKILIPDNFEDNMTDAMQEL